jgi:hypothetical protein
LSGSSLSGCRAASGSSSSSDEVQDLLSAKSESPPIALRIYVTDVLAAFALGHEELGGNEVDRLMLIYQEVKYRPLGLGEKGSNFGFRIT